MSLSLRGLKELYPKTTLELSAERKIAEAKTETIVLSALKDVKVSAEEKRLGFFKRRKSRVENYEEFVERLEEYAELSNQPLTPGRVYGALKDLEKSVKGELREKIKAIRKEVDRKEGISRRKWVGLGLTAALAGAALGGLYYQFIYKPEQAKRPYREAGLTDEQASRFVNKYPNQNGNSTWVSFAKAWAENQSLADSVFQNFKDLNKSLTYLSLSNNHQLLAKALNELGEQAYEFVKAVNNGVNEDIALQLFESSLFRDLAKRDVGNINSILRVAGMNSSAVPKNLAYQVLDQIERDNRVENKIEVAKDAFSLLSELKIYNLRNKASIYIPGNYSSALAQGLPKHSASEIKRLFNASELCSDIVDFEPIVIKDVTGNVIRIESKDLARDYWMIAELLKNRAKVAEEPEKFEWINRMIQQIAWRVFEDEYGPRYFDNKAYKASDAEVWKVILSFHDYMDALPEKLRQDDIPVAFPYWDSKLLKQAIADKTNRTIALYYLASIPAKSFDKENYVSKKNEAWSLYDQGKIDRNKLGDLIEKAYKESIIAGMKGMEKFVEQLPREYEEIASKKKDNYWKNEAMMWVAQWIADRGNHGLANTVSQFIGKNYSEIKTMDELAKIIEDTNGNGITQFLNRNYHPWDLVMFIYGYESFDAGSWGGEWEMYAYGLPIAFKAFGIPLGQMGIRGTSGNLGGPGNYSHGEFAIYGIPQSVIDSLRSQKELGRVAIAFGNGISMLSGIDGVEKDTGYQITHGIRRIEVYLWKK